MKLSCDEEFPLDFWHGRQVFFKIFGNSQEEFINAKGNYNMPLVLVFFPSKRFGICKRPIWGANIIRAGKLGLGLGFWGVWS